MKKITFFIVCLAVAISMQAQMNVALNAAFVSSDIDNGASEVPKVYDGDYTDNSTHSLIVNSSGSSRYFILDLQNASSISTIKLYFGSAITTSYAIYNSMDNYTTPLSSGTCTANITISSFTFPYNINSTRYIKIVLNGTGETINFSLKEFEVYANEAYISFSYDDAGNRTKRELKTIELKSAAQFAEQKDTASQKKFIDEIANHKITLFPVPTQGRLNIEITNLKQDEVTSVYVYDLKGEQIMLTKNLTNGYIDFSNIPSGTYIVRISIGNEQTTWKVIKQ